MLGEGKNPIRPVALDELPPFPAVAIKALRIAADNDMRLHELHQMICTDQVFSAELLRAANSPLHATRTPITSTLQASIRLGFESLKRLVLAVGIRGYVGKLLEVPALRACWRHSLACGIVAEELAIARFAARSEPRIHIDKDFAYTAGIIHDIGRLALAVSRAKPYADFLKSTEKEPCDVLAQERQRFGADHCQIGRSLVRQWNLPPEFLEITSHHHDDVRDRESDALAVVHVSCLLADTLGFSVAHCTDVPTYENVLNGLPEDMRQRFGVSREEYASKVSARINSVEAA